ncbi:MAG: succinate dehydrogenase assembly factor 2 [Gammaproteobacteria bacterium]
MTSTSRQWPGELPTTNQLRWACRRGMLELDLLLKAYMDQVYEQLTDLEKREFLTLLDMQDQEMYEMLTGKINPNDRELAQLLARIRACMGS